MLYTFNIDKIRELPKDLLGRSFYIGSMKPIAGGGTEQKTNKMAPYWAELAPSKNVKAVLENASKERNTTKEEIINRVYRPAYISELLYDPIKNNALIKLLQMLAEPDKDVGIADENAEYWRSSRSLIADICLSYGHAIQDLGTDFTDISHYNQPLPKLTYPLVLPALFHELNNTMPVDVCFVPMISQNVNDTTAGQNLDKMFYMDNSKINRAAGFRYKGDGEATKNTICWMVRHYGWEAHANSNIPKAPKLVASQTGLDLSAPIGVLPVFNIDQFTNACRRMMMLANINRWDYVLVPYVDTLALPWNIVLGIYQSILDSRFIIADEPNAQAQTVMSSVAASMFPSACAIGHKPSDCLGYKASDWQRVDKKIRAVIRQLITDHGTRKFISGGAQGMEQLFFAAVEMETKSTKTLIENWFYQPFQGYADKWPDKGYFSKDDYNKFRQIAQKNKTEFSMQGQIPKDDKQMFAKALSEKNRRMVKDSDIVIAIYKYDTCHITDDADKFMQAPDEVQKSSTTRSLRDAYGTGRAIITIHPDTLKTTRINFDRKNQGGPFSAHYLPF
jgi:hypothetical protein